MHYVVWFLGTNRFACVKGSWVQGLHLSTIRGAIVNGKTYNVFYSSIANEAANFLCDMRTPTWASIALDRGIYKGKLFFASDIEAKAIAVGHALNQIKLETDVAIQREAVKIMTSDFQDFDEVIIINSSDEEDEENVVLHPREVVDVDADTVPSHPPAGVRVRIPNVVWRFDELAGPKFGFYEEDKLSRIYDLKSIGGGGTVRLKMPNVDAVMRLNNPNKKKDAIKKTELFDIRFLSILLYDVFDAEIKSKNGRLVAVELDDSKLKFVKTLYQMRVASGHSRKFTFAENIEFALEQMQQRQRTML